MAMSLRMALFVTLLINAIATHVTLMRNSGASMVVLASQMQRVLETAPCVGWNTQCVLLEPDGSEVRLEEEMEVLRPQFSKKQL